MVGIDGYILIFLICFIFIVYIYKKSKRENVDISEIQDALLVPEEFTKHSAEVARRHITTKKARLSRILIPRMNNNYKFIKATYKALSKSVMQSKSVSPAAEWLLDNFYIIEEQVKSIRKSINKNYKRLPVLKSGPLKGYPRIYAVALEMVAHTEGKIDEETITDFIKAYQSQSLLTTSELWVLSLMILIALIENTRRICEKIYDTDIQWRNVEWIVEREELPDDILQQIKERLGNSGRVNTSYIEHLIQRLRRRGKETGRIISDIEDLLVYQFGITAEQIVQTEHQIQASMQVSIGNSITSMKLLSGIDWTEVFESLSQVEKILEQDPDGTYPKMDFASRDYYRRVIEKMAHKYGLSETQLARKAIECAREASNDPDKRMSHVGLYLIGKGKDKLLEKIGYKPSGLDVFLEKVKRHPALLYIGAITFLTIVLDLLFVNYAYTNSASIVLSIVAAIAVVIPVSEISVEIVNWIITRVVHPKILPKLELKDGIPESGATFIVIPTLLPNKKRAKELLHNLEVFYLANKGDNLYFALLGDFKDAEQKSIPDDEGIVDYAMSCVKDLNKKYTGNGKDIFYYFHRERRFYEGQNRWMGWERKRGALLEFNDMLLGNDTSYVYKSGDVSQLPHIKYIITLDADTQLPINTARELIGTMMHPLNKAIVDEQKRIVVEGYGLLQPRISVNIIDAGVSLFSRVFAGQGGIDPYTTAVSNVYQDIFGEGVYTGKGIYDLEVFQSILKDRIPDNAILSHDLLEGSYVRTGLVTDIELIDGYPSKYNSFAMRLHRWVRGDWQLLPWLKSKVRNRVGELEPNPLSLVSKWKIFDNLRRSLVHPFLMILIALGFSILPGNSIAWLGLALVTTAFPAILEFIGQILSNQMWIYRERRHSTIITGYMAAFYQFILLFAFLPYQAYLMADAVIRTLIRLFFTKKNLMEWVTAADMERRLKNNVLSFFARMWVSSAIAVVMVLLDVLFTPYDWQFSIPLLVLWLCSPWLAYYVSKAQVKRVYTIAHEHIPQLRKYARKTWRYFEDFVTREDNYLPPDNYQEDPPNGLAHRTSPTNIGLSLLSTLAARDFGYISIIELVKKVDRTLTTVEKLDKWNGHLFNWYNTRTLRPLRPLYVSTVDSGNLVGYLITLKCGLEEYMKKTVSFKDYGLGIKDTLELLKEDSNGIEIDVKELNDFLIKDKPSIMDWWKTLNAVSNRLNEVGKRHIWTIWIKKAIYMVNAYKRELEELFPWTGYLSTEPVSEKVKGHLNDVIDILEDGISVYKIEEKYKIAVEKIEELAGNKDFEGAEREWFIGLKNKLSAAQMKAGVLKNDINELLTRIKKLVDETKFAPLYVHERQLFSIGYNVDENQLSKSYYDLLASEARQTSYIAVARGEIDKKHWFRLGRALTEVNGYKGLISWTGTMFEFFMPLLIMKNFENTLLDETYHFVIMAQKLYGKERKIAWGTSEAAFYAFDINLNYQYRAFGVPELGLKRGLANDTVVAPYATMLALPLDAEGAMENLAKLKEQGMDGPYGFYEAIDYTKDRLVRGSSGGNIVKCFMVHHQSMSLVAMDNCLNDNIMQERFHSEPYIRSAEILLQEKVPVGVTFTPDDKPTEMQVMKPVEQEEIDVVRMPQLGGSPLPEVHLLSNGGYSVMVTDKGTGYSKEYDMAVTRWREDLNADNYGMFFYIQNINSNNVWSATYAPYNVKPGKYKVVFSQDKAEFFRTDGSVETHTEIIVVPGDRAEIRRISLTNHSQSQRILEITSYMEPVMAPQASDIAHPSFGNLFVRTEYVKDCEALLANRRPRSSDQEPVWIFNTVVTDGEAIGDVQYETDRTKFIGRGRSLENPVALDVDHPLTNTVGAVLDPVLSLRRRVKVMPGQTVHISYTLGIASSRDEAVKMALKYHDRASIDRAFELAWTRSRVESSYFNLKASELQLYQQIVPQILFISPLRRKLADSIRNSKKGQSGLWAYGISGDIPLVVVCIEKAEDIEIVQKVLKAHEYWRVKGLNVDLVILNEDKSSYMQPLQDLINSAIASSHARDLLGKKGGVFVIQGNNIDEEGRNLLFKVSRIVLKAGAGPIYDQVALEEKEELPAVKKFGQVATYQTLEVKLPELLFYNELGGFSRDGKEYIIYLKAQQNTPAPWINVVANQKFGFQISESGAGYTWAENSRENKLTQWYNDPLIDPMGEVLYLRDDESGMIWSITPKPIREETPYMIRHGHGYSVFEHNSNGLEQVLTEFVPLEDTIKICVVKLKNIALGKRSISIAYYLRPVLGVSDQVTAPYIFTDVDNDTGILLIQNAYNEDFPGRIAFLDVSEGMRTFTGDRKEFFGDGNISSPEGLKREKLSGRIGPGYDPCAVLQTSIELYPQEEKKVIFLLGQCDSIGHVRELCLRYRDITNSEIELNKVKEGWSNLIDTIKVKTPDTSMDLLLNGWLLYQTIACRVWARSAFYQSGGAYGFRDQLQDTMNVEYVYPQITRQQILRSACHQFLEGDVQHWWHPGTERGIRTRCSDDLLWLPFVVADYIEKIGDYEILKEEVPYLKDEPLKEDEHERYSKPYISEAKATLYEHCIKAIEHSLKFGEHGIPLMGSGDWNDGMNNVGVKGKGESIWLGWFLYATLIRFASICEKMGDGDKAKEYSKIAQNIATSIEEHGWDGSWYRRAYFDDGTPLGSAQNSECKIDSIAQSWAVISGAGKPERAIEAMGALEHYLVSKENGLIKLLMPPFDEGDLKPGYIKGYVPGVRENGGQYTHAAVWVIMALALLGNGDKAVEYYNMINPINHTRTPLEVAIYKVEPYVMAADVYAVSPHEGRGGWTWYTGSAGWMYRAGIESILGLKVYGTKMVIDPCIPKTWSEYKIEYRFHSSRYVINIKNPEGVNKGIKEVRLDGQVLKDGVISLLDDGNVHIVDVTMGQLVAQENNEKLVIE